MAEGRKRSIKAPVDAMVVPRVAGLSTFGRLPRADEVDSYDVAVVGVPFDSGVSYRPGARFGPSAIRQASRLLRSYDPSLDTEPFNWQQVVDAGDIPCNPFSIDTAIAQIETSTAELLKHCRHVIALGGDHTIALPLLRANKAQVESLALLRSDAHRDTWPPTSEPGSPTAPRFAGLSKRGSCLPTSRSTWARE